MRPQSIRNFDKLYLGSMAIGIANIVIGWETSMAELEAVDLGIGVMIFGLAFGYGISLLLWYFISREASNIAKWILIVLTAFGVAMMPFSLFELPALELILAVITTGMQLVAIYYLFQPDAKEYFEDKGKGPVDPSVFE